MNFRTATQLSLPLVEARGTNAISEVWCCCCRHQKLRWVYDLKDIKATSAVNRDGDCHVYV
jgi:hypothetical protein